MTYKTYDIVPFQKVGDIFFSDSRDAVREKIGGEYIYGSYEFKDIIELYDFFPEHDIKVLYNKNGCLGAIELFKGAVIFLGKNIMSTPYLELKRMIVSSDPDLGINSDGFTSYKFGIGIAWDEEDDIITSVIVFRPDYYD